jgi:hypothetical protein
MYSDLPYFESQLIHQGSIRLLQPNDALYSSYFANKNVFMIKDINSKYITKYGIFNFFSTKLIRIDILLRVGGYA